MGVFFGSKDAGDSPGRFLSQSKPGRFCGMYWWVAGTPALTEALALLDDIWLSALGSVLEKSYKGSNR